MAERRSVGREYPVGNLLILRLDTVLITDSGLSGDSTGWERHKTPGVAWRPSLRTLLA
jgi:hypothetical protein